MLKLVSPQKAIKLCKDVTDIETLIKLGGDLLFNNILEICHKSQGVGLAAPQVGIYYKFFIAYLQEYNNFGVYVNPKYRPLSDQTVESIESCLTHGKDKPYKIKRYHKILAEWQDIGLVKKIQELNGMSAIIFQHETDHINSITIASIGELNV
jgi:peptide deformylase